MLHFLSIDKIASFPYTCPGAFDGSSKKNYHYLYIHVYIKGINLIPVISTCSYCWLLNTRHLIMIFLIKIRKY